MKTKILNPIYQLVCQWMAASFFSLNMNTNKIASIDTNSSIEAPIGSSDKGVNYFKNLSKLFRKTKMKYAMLVAMAIGTVSCTPEDPIGPEPDTTDPNAAITNVLVKDVDGDGQVDDAEISVTATDNVAVGNVDVSVGGVPASKVGNVYVVTDLSVAQHTARVDVTDTSGNTASATRNFTVAMTNVAPTATVTFNDFGEHTPIGTIVGTVDAADANGDTITTTLEQGGSEFELVLQAGQTNKYDIKTKVAFDYETSGDNAHDIRVKVADATLSNEVNASANETDEDDDRGNENLCGGHDVSIVQTIDVADNDPATENLKKYALNPDGTQISELSALETVIDDGAWTEGSANGLQIKNSYAQEDLLKDSSGNYQLESTTGTNGGLRRLSDGDVLDTNKFLDGLVWLKSKMIDAGYNYTDWRSWTGHHASTSPDDYVFRLVAVYYTENIIKETDGADLDNINAKLLADAFNKVNGKTSAEALTILQGYAAGTQTGGGSCN